MKIIEVLEIIVIIQAYIETQHIVPGNSMRRRSNLNVFGKIQKSKNIFLFQKKKKLLKFIKMVTKMQ